MQLKRRLIASWEEIKVRFAVEQAWTADPTGPINNPFVGRVGIIAR